MKETDNDIVLLLIEENKKLEKEIESLKDGVKVLKEAFDVCQAQVDTLRRKNGWTTEDIAVTIKNYEEIKNEYNYPNYKQGLRKMCKNYLILYLIMCKKMETAVSNLSFDKDRVWQCYELPAGARVKVQTKRIVD